MLSIIERCAYGLAAAAAVVGFMIYILEMEDRREARAADLATLSSEITSRCQSVIAEIERNGFTRYLTVRDGSAEIIPETFELFQTEARSRLLSFEPAHLPGILRLCSRHRSYHYYTLELMEDAVNPGARLDGILEDEE